MCLSPLSPLSPLAWTVYQFASLPPSFSHFLTLKPEWYFKEKSEGVLLSKWLLAALG